jgi:hypothetical protein
MGRSRQIAAGSGTWPISSRSRAAGDTGGETDVLRWRYVVVRKAWRLLIPAVLGLLIHSTSVSPRCGNGGRNLADLAGHE